MIPYLLLYCIDRESSLKTKENNKIPLLIKEYGCNEYSCRIIELLREKHLIWQIHICQK